MIALEERLSTLFENRRLIFWYDEEGEQQEEFNNLVIDGVEKRIIENNEFSLKREMLRLQPTQKFLIYAPYPVPEDEENWLLDLHIANYLFSADSHSMVIESLELDFHFKAFLSQFEKFFNASSRTASLKKLLSSGENEESLALKMMAVAIKSDDNLEVIMLRLFASEKHFEILQKFGLDKPLFQALKTKFDYEGDTIQDLIYKMLQNHFYFYIDQAKCQLNREALLFVKNWKDSNRYRELFEELSTKTSRELNIEQTLHSVEVSKMEACDTYEQCERVIITDVLQKILDERIESKSIDELIALREHTFWFRSYQNIYYALLNASKLFDFIRAFKPTMNSFEEGIEAYVEEWHRADKYYRDYIYHSDRAEHIELLKSLDEQIENLYLNSFLRELNDKWEGFAQTYTTNLSLPHQQQFYKREVEPILAKGQRVFVIISDALRYECGVDLNSKIRGIDKYTSECDYQIGSLPSYTQLGMASLLPHQKLMIGDKNDTVYADGKSTKGRVSREKILQSHSSNAIAIGCEEFLKLKKSEGRSRVKESNLIYIYHDEIDKMGEKNENKTFDAVQSSFETLTKIIKQVSNFNGSNMFITSDHGFLYTKNPTQESEFCKVQVENSIKFNRRFIIGKSLNGSSCVAKYQGFNLGIEGGNEFLIAKSINKIRIQGGGNRFVHGGASLQELVTPLIRIKKRRGTKEDTQNVNVEIIPIPTISTNYVTVSLYQTEVVSEKVKPLTLSMLFIGEDGQELSDEIRHTFDSKEQYGTNRESKFRFTFKNNVHQYNNKFITFMTKEVLNNSSETPIFKTFEVKLSLSFFDDNF